MTGFLFEMIRDTYRAPRIAARRVIETVRTPQEIALIFGISATIASIFMVLGIMGQGASGGLLGLIIANLIMSALAFAFIVGLVFGIGRLFGGEGTLFTVAAVMAWHSLATVIFAPFISPAVIMDGFGPGMAVQIAIVLVVTWLLVSFIAEVHGFKSAWRVAGVLLGAIVLLSLLLPLLLPGVGA